MWTLNPKNSATHLRLLCLIVVWRFLRNMAACNPRIIDDKTTIIVWLELYIRRMWKLWDFAWNGILSLNLLRNLTNFVSSYLDEELTEYHIFFIAENRISHWFEYPLDRITKYFLDIKLFANWRWNECIYPSVSCSITGTSDGLYLIGTLGVSFGTI